MTTQKENEKLWKELRKTMVGLELLQNGKNKGNIILLHGLAIDTANVAELEDAMVGFMIKKLQRKWKKVAIQLYNMSD